MLRAALRGLVVPAVGAAALLGLALAPEAARADDECGAASNGVATCAASTGNFDDAIRYNVGNDDSAGLTLTILPREDSDGMVIARQIRTTTTTSGDFKTGNGIGIFGSRGNGAGLHLIVQGDTNIVRRNSSQRGSRDGIRVSNGGANTRDVSGSVTVEVGAEVDIGKSDGRIHDNGIHAIVEAGPSGTTASNAGIRVTNAGTIHVHKYGIRAEGAGFKIVNPSADHLNGRVEVTHSGSISSSREGIYALSKGNADVAVALEAGGSITRPTLSNPNAVQAGIYAETMGTKGPGGSGNVTVTSAGNITVPYRGAGIRARVTSGTGTLSVTTTGGTIMTRDDTGIHTTSGDDAGATTITVGAGSTVTGGTHGVHAMHAGTAGVNINVAGTVTGGSDADEAAIKIEAGGAATVTLTNEFTINGDIVFDGNDDNDMLTLTVAENMRGQVMDKIMGVDSLVKNGLGTAWLGDDVTFSGSSAEIKEGVLVLRGHLDLGDDGTLTVTDGAKLMVEVGGPDDHGQVTAGTVTPSKDSDENGEVFLSFVEGEQETAARAKFETEGFEIFRSAVPYDTNVKRPDGTVVAAVGCGGSIQQDDFVKCPEPEPEDLCPDGTPMPCMKKDMDDDDMDGMDDKVTPPTSGSGSDSDNNNNRKGFLVVSGTAMAFLLSNIFEAGAVMGWSEDAGVWPGTAAHGFSSARSGNRPDAKGLEYQVRLLDGAMPSPGMTAPVSAMSAAVRAHLGGGFHTELSATPKLAADGGRDAVSGSRYGLGLGWRSGVLSTDIGYSHAALDARSTFTNLEGLGELSGRYGLRHDQLQANAKLDLDAGGMKVSPSVSLFGGKVSQDGYTASSRVWLSEVPSVSQEYAGWKAGLTMGSRSELKGMGLRWRPEIRLTTMRLASGGGAGEMELVQRDRAGALRMQTTARASLPRTVHALGSGLTVAGGENWSVRGGYVALLADGEFEHAAGARFRLRF